MKLFRSAIKRLFIAASAITAVLSVAVLFAGSADSALSLLGSSCLIAVSAGILEAFGAST